MPPGQEHGTKSGAGLVRARRFFFCYKPVWAAPPAPPPHKKGAPSISRPRFLYFSIIPFCTAPGNIPERRPCETVCYSPPPTPASAPIHLTEHSRNTPSRTPLFREVPPHTRTPHCRKIRLARRPATLHFCYGDRTRRRPVVSNGTTRPFFAFNNTRHTSTLQVTVPSVSL